jgi:surfeit locus 1 family protein
VAAALCAAFIGLGRWQWERAQQREEQWANFARGEQVIMPLGAQSTSALTPFQRISLTGAYDSSRQFLLDNRSHAGRPGYEVLTPFTLTDGRTLLVDRGWIAFTGFREQLPSISFNAPARLVVTGRVAELPSAGLARGRSAPAPGDGWPKLTSFPDMRTLSSALGRPLEPRIVLLDPQAPYGFVREWQPPGLSPDRHRAYAIQWWAFAALMLLFWLVAFFRHSREPGTA